MKRSFILILHAVITAVIVVLTALPASGSPARNRQDDPGLAGHAEAGQKDVFSGFDEFQDSQEAAGGVYDPLIGYNRFMTRVNDRLYFYLLKPTARAYSAVVVKPVREAISRAFQNIYFPIRFVNNLFQLKARRAGIETARFGINSTIGIAGLFDPARSRWDLPAYPEDFGQTLAYWGVGVGFYLVLPVLGPSNLRDSFGLVPDYYLFDPVFYMTDNTWVSFGVTAGDYINTLSLNPGVYEQMKKEALDFYIFLRNAYEQKRQKEIRE